MSAGREGVTKWEPNVTVIKDDVTYTYDAVLGTDVFEMLADEVEACNRHNGWFDEDRRFAEGIALLHSEASEALDAFRDQGMAETVDYRSEDGFEIVERGSARDKVLRAAGRIGKPIGVPSEYADVLIRLLDSARRDGVDLMQATREKLTYNWTRGYKHGGKRL